MRWFAALLLFLYCGFIIRLTFFDPSSSRPVFASADYVSELLSGGRLDAAQIEALSNVALFVPAGLLLAVVLGRLFLTVTLCVAASIAIELTQRLWLPSRVPDPADVLHNGMGAAFGVLLAWGLGIVCYPRLHSAHGSPAS